jgi:hypothetical protein
MNERINQIIEECTEYWADKGDTYFDKEKDTYFDKEKFAELIVGECYETIKKDMELAHIQLIPIDFGIYANGRLRRIIKEHFGVEE